MRKLGRTKGETKRVLACRRATIEDRQAEFFGMRKVLARKKMIADMRSREGVFFR